MEVLLRADGQVVPTADLVSAADVATVRALRTHLSVLRARLGDRAACVEGVRGVGYRWHDASTPQLRADTGTAVLDADTGTLTAGGQTVRLTRQQAALVRVLSQSRWVTISADELQQRIGAASPAAVKVHASAARHALREVLPGAIVGVRGGGFRYEGLPVEMCRRASERGLRPYRRPNNRFGSEMTGRSSRRGTHCWITRGLSGSVRSSSSTHQASHSPDLMLFRQLTITAGRGGS